MQIRRLMTAAFFPTYLKNPCTRVSNYDFNPSTVYLNTHNDHESVILSATATDSFGLRTKLCAWIYIPFKGKRTFSFINYILENLASLLVSMTYFWEILLGNTRHRYQLSKQSCSKLVKFSRFSR